MKHLRSRAHRHLCAVLATARRDAGLTQRELATKLRRPRSYVANIEIGERRIDVLEFIELSKVLRIDPQKLFKRVLLQADRSYLNST